MVEETDQVREFRDGLLDDLGRVHGEISGLLERTRMQRDQALDAGDAAAKAVPNGKAKQPAEPAKVAEDQADHPPPAKVHQGTCSGGLGQLCRLRRSPCLLGGGGRGAG